MNVIDKLSAIFTEINRQTNVSLILWPFYKDQQRWEKIDRELDQFVVHLQFLTLKQIECIFAENPVPVFQNVLENQKLFHCSALMHRVLGCLLAVINKNKEESFGSNKKQQFVDYLLNQNDLFEHFKSTFESSCHCQCSVVECLHNLVSVIESSISCDSLDTNLFDVLCCLNGDLKLWKVCCFQKYLEFSHHLANNWMLSKNPLLSKCLSFVRSQIEST